jgi:hypothetical protein
MLPLCYKIRISFDDILLQIDNVIFSINNMAVGRDEKLDFKRNVIVT